MTNKYKLEHITDIAKIPEDEIAMFISEIPTIHREMRALAGICGQDNLSSIMSEIVWHADNSDHIDTELHINGNHVATLTTKEPNE